jgi:hypothetical protein
MDHLLLSLASRLPSGLIDPMAGEKFDREFVELQDELHRGDDLGALLECADCLYYATKAEYNGIFSADEARAKMARVYTLSGFSPGAVQQAAIAKYKLRARPGNPKSDGEERAAVAVILGK